MCVRSYVQIEPYTPVRPHWSTEVEYLPITWLSVGRLLVTCSICRVPMGSHQILPSFLGGLHLPQQEHGTMNANWLLRCFALGFVHIVEGSWFCCCCCCCFHFAELQYSIE